MITHRKHVLGLAALATLAYACSTTSRSESPEATSNPASPAATKSALPSVGPTAEDPWLAELHKKPTPHDGCFTAAPGADHEWREVPCNAAPVGARPRQKGVLSAPIAAAKAPAAGVAATAGGGAQNPWRAPKTELVGGAGGDATGALPAGLLVGATGSFPSVVGGANESDNGSGAAHSGSNSYTLQMNTNLWGNSSTPSQCQSATNFECQGWEQFVYDAVGGVAYIEYTLINYGPVESGKPLCPNGYSPYPNYNSQPDCYFNTNSINVPSVAPQNLQSANLIMKASTNGVSDFLEIDVNGVPYKGSWPSVEGLASGWTSAEFNLFGDSNGTQAVFSSPTTMEVQVLLDTASPSLAEPNLFAPSSGCPSCGTSTAETNTLNLIGSPCAFGGTQPGFQFMQSNVPGAVAPACPSLGVTANPLFVPQGDFAQSTIVLNGDLVGQSSNTALLPTTCALSSGSVSATLEPTAGSNITFNYHVPFNVPVGSQFTDTLLCNNGQTVNQPIIVSAQSAANMMYLSPGNNPLEVTQGSEAGANLLMYGPWQAADRGVGAVGQVLSNPIPGGTITLYPGTSENGTGIMGVMVNTSSSTPVGTYSVQIVVTDPASQVALISSFSVEVLACVPALASAVCSQMPGQCGPTWSLGCGLTTNCGTCASGDTCSFGFCCPNGEEYNSQVGCVPLTCPTGEELCTAVGAGCMTIAACDAAINAQNRGSCRRVGKIVECQ
jgi:hypothetical protein